MRKVIFQNMVTLDGFFEGPGRNIDWHVVDDDFNEVAIRFLNSLDALLFGRVTYQLMANYWPSAEAVANDPIVASHMNTLSKVVFSRTLDRVEWTNSRLVKDHAAEEVARLKRQPGKDMAIFGSANLAVTLMQNDLIDEYRIFVNPVILGGGMPLFQGITKRMSLKLLQTKVFKSGLVLLEYQPAR